MVAGIPGVQSLRCEGNSAHFRTPTPTATLAALMALLDAEGAHLVELNLQKATLEDIFIELTGSGLRD